jgi:hypothetical protein|tara:strand:- start:1873 stop:2253 length:381 start_codon:yes stop_codon:yes gene_type:complete
MSRIEIVNKRTGYTRREGDVLVDRTTMWGNPWRLVEYVNVEYVNTRDFVCDAYATRLRTHPELVARLAERNPKRLICWCAPKRCHAESLRDALEGEERDAIQSNLESGTLSPDEITEALAALKDLS